MAAAAFQRAALNLNAHRPQKRTPSPDTHSQPCKGCAGAAPADVLPPLAERFPAGTETLSLMTFDFFDEGKVTYVAAHMDSLMQCTRSFLQL
jgi:hypothetical protein